MPDSVYDFEFLVSDTHLGGHVYTDDGSGIDTIVVNGTYINSNGNWGADIRLDYGLNQPTIGTHAASVGAWKTGPVRQVTALIYGVIENAIGGGGNENIIGNFADNYLQGDPLLAAGSDDQLAGGAGNDTLVGAGGADLLQGGSDNDLIFGDIDATVSSFNNVQSGNDILQGGSGDDTLSGGYGDNWLDGGDGVDTADYGQFRNNDETSFRLVVDLNIHSAQLFRTDYPSGHEFLIVTDSIYDIESVIGTDGDDVMKGEDNFSFGLPGSNTLDGGAGDDLITGGYYADLLLGGDGNDTLDDGGNLRQKDEDADVMGGGMGDDTYVINWNNFVFEASGQGHDLVISAIDYALPGEVEDLDLTGFLGRRGDGNSLDNAITGTQYANTLSGWDGNDTLSGEEGADTLDGGSGVNLLRGGLGNDTYLISAAQDAIVETSGQGTVDVVQASVSFRLTTGAEVERITTNDALGLAAINLTGNELAQSVTGNAGRNSLRGLGGDDSLFGGAGVDTLRGGSGSDLVSGGAGADVFVFDAKLGAGNVDTLRQFNAAEDSILLESFFFRGLATGALAANAFVANTSGLATRGTHRIIYETDTGNLSFDSDGKGGAAAILFATLTPNLAGFDADLFSIV